MQQMADHLVVITAGRMMADESLDSFVSRSTRNDVLVRCTDPSALAAALAAEGITAVASGPDGLAVTSSDTDHVGDVAFRAGIGIRELTRRTASLEEAFLELTSGQQQFATGQAPPPPPPPPPSGWQPPAAPPQSGPS
jgi:ABC-2 type transport system ATP-binding protein